MCRAARLLKREFPELGLVGDVALDPYTDHGHDGVIRDTRAANMSTTTTASPSWSTQAVNQAEAGIDIIAPSDMMDGRIGAIRAGAGRARAYRHAHHVLCGEVRLGLLRPLPRCGRLGAARCAATRRPTRWTRPTRDEALREVALDLAEGADMVMVKPGMPYLDIVRRVKDRFGVPTFAYQVSGEYAMIMAAVNNGWLEHDRAMLESLLGFKRAGANGVLTYFAVQAAQLLRAG